MANNDPETVAQLYGVFLYKKKDIIAIQKKLGISGNANQLVVPPVSELMGKTLADSYELLAEEVDENMRAYLRKLKEFHGPLEDDPGVIFPKYGEMGVKKIMFTGERLPLFPKLSPQQLHEIFVKNPSSAGQCPCLEQVS
ncbi:hypothetical protein GLOIN_2v1766619 [Rhizophagus irregularis DAOM 181602=DAOM 197198]|nr:hypothetical protein GLOIN_2v1766619 [Rhizophagus irregularis DAOM 181602=DAOM 197198]